MVDVRRAYRQWFWRRMSWLCPGLAAAVVVFVRLALDETLELWLRLPALVISGGVTLLFVGLTLLPALVLAAGRRRQSRRAQLLRREFRSYPALALVSLSLAFMLLAVPLLLAPHPTGSFSAPQVAFRGHRGTMPSTEPVQPDPDPIAAFPEAPAEPVPTTAIPPPPAPVVDPVKPADPIAAAPEQEPLKLPDPPAPPIPTPAAAPAELPSGQELSSLKFRPDDGDWLSLRDTGSRMPKGLDRGGLPDERSADENPLPRLTLDLTIVPQSRGWYGAIYEAGLDVPTWKDGSIRASYFYAALNDEEGEVEFEPSMAWHRATIEVEQRLAGYTRHATFDLAVRAGIAVDRLTTHDTSLEVSSAPRPAPMIGIEVAIWEQDGLGLVTQVAHSFAVRVNGVASSTTDLKIELHLDLSERTTFTVGYRYIAVRAHEQGADFSELEHSFSGPMAGLSIAF